MHDFFQNFLSGLLATFVGGTLVMKHKEIGRFFSKEVKIKLSIGIIIILLAVYGVFHLIYYIIKQQF